MGIFTSPLALVFAAASIGAGLFIGLKLVSLQRKAIRDASSYNRGVDGTPHITSQPRESFVLLKRLTVILFRFQLIFTPLVFALVLGLGAPILVGLIYLAAVVWTGGIWLLLRRVVKASNSRNDEARSKV
jgi:hypothetical protein